MATFKDLRAESKKRGDTHVYKIVRGHGKRRVTANPIFFDAVVSVEVIHDERGPGAVIAFEAGGRLDVFRGSDPLWVEPERH